MAVGLETSFNRLSVVPLIARVPSAPQRYITLDEALTRGDFEVTEMSEGGQVPQLHVLNTGMHPVLLVDGEELIGAKQNRIVNLTILVPAMEKLSIPVTCVEAGRWNRRSRGFASSGNAQYSRARANKVVQVSQSLAETGEARSDQHWIWDDIAAKADRMKVNSSTSAMSNIFDARQPSLDEHVMRSPLPTASAAPCSCSKAFPCPFLMPYDSPPSICRSLAQTPSSAPSS